MGRYPVPDEAHRLVEQIAAEYFPDPNDDRPTVVFVPTYSPTRFGGRHFPKENAIAIYDSRDRDLWVSVVVHEMAHSIRLRTGDPHGHHDDDFYEVLGELYEKYGVSSALARDVEPFCDACEHTWKW